MGLNLAWAGPWRTVFTLAVPQGTLSGPPTRQVPMSPILAQSYLTASPNHSASSPRNRAVSHPEPRICPCSHPVLPTVPDLPPPRWDTGCREAGISHRLPRGPSCGRGLQWQFTHERAVPPSGHSPQGPALEPVFYVLYEPGLRPLHRVVLPMRRVHWALPPGRKKCGWGGQPPSSQGHNSAPFVGQCPQTVAGQAGLYLSEMLSRGKGQRAGEKSERGAGARAKIPGGQEPSGHRSHRSQVAGVLLSPTRVGCQLSLLSCPGPSAPRSTPPSTTRPA